MERYVAALARELRCVPAGTPLARLVVGGGTPTALPADLFETMLKAIHERMRPVSDRAQTIEVSPDSLTDEHLRVLGDCRIGRVSMGVESLDGTVLGHVHRRHTPAQALDASKRVADSGLTLNVDLIYGLPRQTEDSFRRDVEAVAETGAATLCLYGLRLNERTAVAAQLDAAERLDLARVMRWRAFVKQAAEDAGFVQTRPYTFKRAGTGPSWHEPRASARAAAAGAEIGIGMSARSQLGHAVYRNHENCDVYLRRIEEQVSPVESVFDLDRHDLQTQFIARTLGNGRALEREAYQAAFESSVDADFGPLLERLRDGELIADDGRRILLTETGTLVYDRVLLGFYSARARAWLDQRPVDGRRVRRDAH
jgi:oxygen-independent coproporphyrinogen-3 oxidase